MSRNHKIKTIEDHYFNVKNGTKTFEIRVNDRAYQKGDTVDLAPVYRDSKSNMINHTALRFEVGDVYPIDADRVVFSLLKLEEKDVTND
jgi:hypothetical protein